MRSRTLEEDTRYHFAIRSTAKLGFAQDCGHSCARARAREIIASEFRRRVRRGGLLIVIGPPRRRINKSAAPRRAGVYALSRPCNIRGAAFAERGDVLPTALRQQTGTKSPLAEHVNPFISAGRTQLPLK